MKYLISWFPASQFSVNKYPNRCNVYGYLFTAKSLYILRVSQHPSAGVLKTVTAAYGTGHNTGTATSLQLCLMRPRWREVPVPVHVLLLKML
jgi:hypothetical protein